MAAVAYAAAVIGVGGAVDGHRSIDLVVAVGSLGLPRFFVEPVLDDVGAVGAKHVEPHSDGLTVFGHKRVVDDELAVRQDPAGRYSLGGHRRCLSNGQFELWTDLLAVP